MEKNKLKRIRTRRTEYYVRVLGKINEKFVEAKLYPERDRNRNTYRINNSNSWFNGYNLNIHDFHIVYSVQRFVYRVNTRKTVRVLINFSGKKFQSYFNNYKKNLPTYEEVATEVLATVQNEKVIWSTHKLTKAQEKFIVSKARKISYYIK